MSDQKTFEVVVPYVVLDGAEYTLLTDEEIRERRVSEEWLRQEEAAKQTAALLREVGLLPKDGEVTEVQIQEAREQWALLTSSRYRQDLTNRDLILEQETSGEIVVERPAYTMKEPRMEDLAEARQAALTKDGAVDTDLYHASLARSLFVSTTRQDVPVNKAVEQFKPELLRKLGAAAHNRGTLGEVRLAFALRSRKLLHEATA